MDQNRKNKITEIYSKKVEDIYNSEPDAEVEEKQASTFYPGSKHQMYIRNLNSSGKSIEEIQTLWHQYYVSLSEEEKKEVWNEFYEKNTHLNFKNSKQSQKPNLVELRNTVVKPKHRVNNQISHTYQSPKKIKLNKKQQFKSLIFGLSLGLVVVIIFLFGFFNEVIITPFIQPSTKNNTVPIIIGQQDYYAASTNQVIIPKINVQIPVDYSLNTTDEKVIENSLDNGVIHYPTTVLPGQNGNAAYFGHSSNNIFNSGKYKFAFVLLHQLTKGDTFYLSYNHIVYVYKVIYTQIVSPSDVSVLNSVAGQTATATLITCDPPGTSINRLVVVGQQISPNPSGNSAASTNSNVVVSKKLPGNGPNLLSKLLSTFYGKVLGILIVSAFVWYIFRSYRKYKTIY